MKNILACIAICMVASCGSEKDKGKFTLTGEIKNSPDQQIYLEQLFFNEKNPEVLDTGNIKNGKFMVSATAAEEGMYRIRMEKNGGGYIFINDTHEIVLKADLNDTTLAGPAFNTKANSLLKDFFLNIYNISTSLKATVNSLENLKTTKNNDSAVAAEEYKLTEGRNRFKQYVINYIDTSSDPVVSMFALGYTRGMDPKELNKSVTAMSKRFSGHQGVTALVAQFKKTETQPVQPPVAQTPGVGSMAPDITMPDTEGKTFSLSSLKGQYVLVDFWASWCGPCRGENPNIVAAYKKYKNKNFTILGVSLDEDKDDWINAIKSDGLAWKQISDLKHFNSAAVGLYGFDGIPYNVLIDPQGKIIATLLLGSALDEKLDEVLH